MSWAMDCHGEFEFLNTPPSVAVWFESPSITGMLEPPLIVALWNDGNMMWSENSIYGGAPYFHGKTSVDIGRLLGAFQNKGYFSEKYARHNVGPDSSCTAMFVSAGTNSLLTRSWHEIAEQRSNTVARSTGLTSLDGRNRDEVLKNDNPEYQQYRAMWADIRAQINNALPEEKRILKNVKVFYHDEENPPLIKINQKSNKRL